MRRLDTLALLLLLALDAGSQALADPPVAPAAPPRPLDGWASLEECATQCGLQDVEPGRCAAVDLDGDGLADLVVGAGKRVFRDTTIEGRPQFHEVSVSSGLAPVDGKRGADVLAWGDVDGDGDIDCFY